MSSNPAHVVRKTSLVRKATGNHLIITTTLSEAQRALSLVSATLEIEYVTQFSFYDSYDIAWTFNSGKARCDVMS